MWCETVCGASVWCVAVGVWWVLCVEGATLCDYVSRLSARGLAGTRCATRELYFCKYHAN